MKRPGRSEALCLPTLGVALLLAGAPARAADGVVEINQVSVTADSGTFPLVIAQSGSYVLTSNLSVPANTNAIEVNAANVTIDLNGFTIAGPGATTTGKGILVSGDQPRVRVRNGSLRGFQYAVDAGGGADHVIEDLQIDCVLAIRAPGPGHRVRHVTATATQGGFELGDHSIVRDCRVASGLGLPASFAIAVGDYSSVVGCSVRTESTVGFGVNVGDNGLVKDCTILLLGFDGGIGIQAGPHAGQFHGVTFTGNTVRQSSLSRGTGIQFTGGIVSDNSIIGFNVGIAMNGNGSATISRNACTQFQANDGACIDIVAANSVTIVENALYGTAGASEGCVGVRFPPAPSNVRAAIGSNSFFTNGAVAGDATIVVTTSNLGFSQLPPGH